MTYKLSATLLGHSSDVKALSSPTNDLVLSASRDTTAVVWQKTTPPTTFTPESLLKAGSRYVNAITYIPSTPDAPQGYAVTGGQDTVINVFALDSPNKEEPKFSLLGHSENVCALNATAGGTIISGSWDRTAKVWKNFQLAYDLKGHQQSVWAVLAIDEDKFLTASADKTIKLWQQHKCLHTYQGHTDAVRGLALLPDIGFASCSNDSEIRVWTFEGDPVYTLSGHTSFVYSLSVLPNGDIVSGGEDRSVRVWHDGECQQTIIHPAISVWTVSTMPNGDIVSGCSDHAIRIFSASEERWASAEDLKAYDDHVASQALPAQQGGDVKKSDLPGPEALSQPGKKAGEVKMVKNGDVIEAHQWDSLSSSWQKIGDVVDAVGSGRKQLYDGKEYDYVFDVDIKDGAPPLKLPYNVTDNPYGAAQRFLERNELPLTYLDEVVRFIEQNTSGVNLGGGNNDYVDPYTGASRYQSSAASAPSAPASSYMDPYTGASRYSGATATPAQAPTSAPALSVLPAALPVLFKQANVAAMEGKLFQFDEALRSEASTSSLATSPEETTLLKEAFSHLSQCVAASAVPSSTLRPDHIKAVMHILSRWPVAQRFPVIDLSRLLIGFCRGAFAAPGSREEFLGALFIAAEWDEPWTTPLPKARETNTLLLLRTVANVFQEDSSIQGGWADQLLATMADVQYEALTKPQRVALATIYFNLSCVFLRMPPTGILREQLLALVSRMLQAEKNDSEAAYRAFVALGNVVFAAKKHAAALSASQATNVKSVAGALQTAFFEDRFKTVGKDIGSLL